MKKILGIVCLCILTTASVLAVPAKRGWQTRTQADGTTIEVMQLGDEFYHYFINRDGQQVKKNAEGIFEVVGEAPSVNKVQAKRAQARRARKEVGVTPNLAPRGVVILANFKDTKMKSSHTLETFTELCNAENCTVNSGYPSAREYFRSQSKGAYEPVFDVFGPVTLSKSYSYYGNNVPEGSDDAEDEYATDATIEACILANQQYADLDFSQYDSDNDGYVDFVYVIYAGYGEADSDDPSTIWPHNWSIQELVTNYTDYTKYTKADTKLDGVYLDNYAMSSELEGQGTLSGIGTLCHEFGHVIGLPDFYDTAYGTNFKNALTPNDWDVMDGGAYNGDGHCPPNYSPWELYFFGWHTPTNLGSEGQLLELTANGKDGYQAYQINTSDKQQSATTSGECYYIENRQQQGWDEGLPSHGMLIWKVNYNAQKWAENTPNNTANSPLYTIVSASGTKIGTHVNSSQTASVYDGPKNPYPGSAKVTTKTIAGKPLTDISEANGIISLIYIEEPVGPVDTFDITWMAQGEVFATTQCPGKVVLPANNPEACEGWVFAGWGKQAEYIGATAPTFVKAGEKVSEGAVFYAVYGEQSGEGSGAAVEDELTCATTGVSGTNYTDWSNKTVSSSAVYAGNSAGGHDAIQLRSKNSNSGIVSTTSGGKLTKVSIEWNENTTDERKLDIYGSNEAYSGPSELYGSGSAQKGTKIGSLEVGVSTELVVDGEYTFVGVRSNNGALYLDKLTFTWGGGSGFSTYSTQCGASEGIEETTSQAAAQKVLRDGQVLIIRNGVVYNVQGAVVQ